MNGLFFLLVNNLILGFLAVAEAFMFLNFVPQFSPISFKSHRLIGIVVVCCCILLAAIIETIGD